MNHTCTYSKDLSVDQACSRVNRMKRSNHSSSNGKSVHLNHESFLVAAYDIIELTRKKSGDHLAFDICLMTPSS